MFKGTGYSIIENIIKMAITAPFFLLGFDVIHQVAEEINNSISSTGLVATDAMKKAFGSNSMAYVLIIAGICGIVTSWNAFLIGGSRAIYSMADSYMIPKSFTKIHSKYKSPVNALLLIGILSVIAPFFGIVMIVWIVDAANFTCCTVYCMVSISFLVLRKKEPNMEGPYKIKNYKITGLIACIMSGLMARMYIIPGTSYILVCREWVVVGGWTVIDMIFAICSRHRYRELFASKIGN